MDNAQASIIEQLVGLPILVLLLIAGRSSRGLTLADIQARYQAEQAQREAELAAEEAKEIARQIQWQADQERVQAQVRQEEAQRAAAQTAAAIERMKVWAEQTVRTAKLAEEPSKKLAERLAKEARRATREAEKLAREAKEARERTQKIREDAERTLGRDMGEEIVLIATEETRRVSVEVKEGAERWLKEGIKPVVIPSPEDFATAKQRIQYREDYFHLAVTGISGSGKSSLINAFRGLRSRDVGAAAVGGTKTTSHMTRYIGTNSERPYVWYDFPGAGILKCRDWQYFNNQGLYVFDCIVVLFDNRFTMADIAILFNARRFNIPTYIVRSKADQYIRNIMIDMGYDSGGDDEDDVERRNKLYKGARKQFIEKTRRSVQTNLENANLPDQRVYIVSNNTLLSVVSNKMPKKTIDEVELVNDLINVAYTRQRADHDTK